MQSYLVTGVADFIGSNLVEALIHKGKKVRAMENLVTGRLENIESFLADDKELVRRVEILCEVLVAEGAP
jgi:nucleoside-diphosphate-sugar epimerase